jgi:hypothetical protein
MATERLRQYTALGGTGMMMPGRFAAAEKTAKAGKVRKIRDIT